MNLYVGQFTQPSKLDFKEVPRNALQMASDLSRGSPVNRAFLTFEEWLKEAYATLDSFTISEGDPGVLKDCTTLQSQVSTHLSALDDIKQSLWEKEKLRLGFSATRIPKGVTVINTSKSCL